MEANANVKFVRISPQKMIPLADMVRGKGINQALSLLQASSRKRTAEVIYKVLRSAVANADQKGAKDVDKLFVKTIMVNQGPTYKRFRPRAKGAASGILKRTSHVSVTVAEK